MSETGDTADPREQLLAIDNPTERCQSVAGYLINVLAAEDRLPDMLDENKVKGPFDITPTPEEFRSGDGVDELREQGDDAAELIEDVEEDDITAAGFSAICDDPQTARAISTVISEEKRKLADAADALEGIHPPTITTSVSESSPIPDVNALALVSISYPNLAAELKEVDQEASDSTGDE